MATGRGGLKPAHSGYRYQDIATAYLFVKALIENYDSVTVDKKVVPNDKLDDLEVIISGQIIRRQFKSSQNADRALRIVDFLGKGSSLRFDLLFLTHINDQRAPLEHRLCATWKKPEQGDALWDFLVTEDAPPTFAGSAPALYRLSIDKLWPEDGKPAWDVLEKYYLPESKYGRDAVAEFCEKFLIEIELPTISRELSSPGPFENFLLEILRSKVGVGRYPNNSREPVDVAALVISLATSARTYERTLVPSEIEKQLDIRTDFGKISQAFPLEQELLVSRLNIHRELDSFALEGGTHIVIAPPGSGKSWELTCLVDRLRAMGAKVARHYCYLEPEDELVERRITTDVFFGNLLADLYEAVPELRRDSTYSYSADLEAFENALKIASDKLDNPVVVIVDGLDHISRVQDAAGLSIDETSIIEAIAAIDFPENVTVILGTQPGEHLKPVLEGKLHVVNSFFLPDWELEDLITLARLYRVGDTLESVGIPEKESIKLLSLLAKKAEGNPLYARYLSKSFEIKLSEGEIESPYDWLNDAPKLEGNISSYYKYLFASASRQTMAIGDLFGVLDFSVTKTELAEIVPFFTNWIDEVLFIMAPVLTSTVGQGGYRIFHESFRRFILEELEAQGRSLGSVLQPVTDWLEGIGFYENSKSYRFLLPALYRSKQFDEVLNIVDRYFVSKSVAQVYPSESIERNLNLAAQAAAESLDWPALARISELVRSANAFFENDREGYDREYWEAYIQVYGAGALAHKMLFDGRPVYSKHDGIIACFLIDDAGGVAPWNEYLSLYEMKFSSESYYEDEDLDSLHWNEEVFLSAMVGMFRIGLGWRSLRWIIRILQSEEGGFRPSAVRRLGKILTDETTVSLTEKIIERAFIHRASKSPASCKIGMMLKLGLADFYIEQGDLTAAKTAANDALHTSWSPKFAMECVSYGADISTALLFADDPRLIDIAVEDRRFIDEVSNHAQWIASIRLKAYADEWLVIYSNELARIDGEDGWYRCWLRFVLALADAEAKQSRGDTVNITQIFSFLTEDLSPFSGEPRACDLYRLHGLIKQSIGSALKLLQTEGDWETALDTIARVGNELGTSFDREDGGPLTKGNTVSLLLPYIDDSAIGQRVYEALEQAVDNCDQVGTYYSVHASYMMSLACAQSLVGDTQLAMESWQKSSVFLTAYTFRKDVTLFEVIDSVGALASLGKVEVLKRICNLQTLTHIVQLHTDGRSTKHTPNSWFDELLKVNSVAAIDVLAKTIQSEGQVDNWSTIRALKDVANYLLGRVSPYLLDALWKVIPFDVEYENSAEEAVAERLEVISLLDGIDSQKAKNSFTLLASSIYKLNSQNGNLCIPHMERAAKVLGLEARELLSSGPYVSVISPNKPNQLKLVSFIDDSYQARFILPENHAYAELLARIRRLKGTYLKDQKYWDGFITSLSYFISELCDSREEDKAKRLIYFLARDLDHGMSGKLHPLGKLGRMLENSGHIALAVVSFSLAYAASRGSSGWSSLGDSKHRSSLEKAIALDKETALSVLSHEISYKLNGLGYSTGITKGIIQRAAEWGESGIAVKAWDEAYRVIADRLPNTASSSPSNWFFDLVIDDIPDWGEEEAIVLLLLSCINEQRLEHKNAAISGVLDAVLMKPEIVACVAEFWLKVDVPISSAIIFLSLLHDFERAPYTISEALTEYLQAYAKCDSWTIRHLARKLLERSGFALTSDKVYGDTSESREEPTRGQVARLFWADKGSVLPLLNSIWPDIIPRVAIRFESFNPIEKGTINHSKITQSIEINRDTSSRTEVPVLGWHNELFITSLNTELNEIYQYLWKKGEWTEDTLDQILSLTVPHIPIHSSLSASFTSRPRIAMPTQLKEGLFQEQLIKESCFDGWTRLGLYEEQFIDDRDKGYGERSGEIVTVAAGLVAAELFEVVPPGAWPFRTGLIQDWLGQFSDRAIELPYHGPIIKIGEVNDWLGEEKALIPPVELVRFLNLKLPEHGGPLVWRDQGGDPMLLLRRWRRNAPYRSDNYDLIGMDMIAHPRVKAFLQRSSCGPLKELRSVSRRNINLR